MIFFHSQKIDYSLLDGGDEEDDEDEKFPDDDEEEPVNNKSVDDFIQGNDEDDEEVIPISDIEDSPVVRKPAPAKRKLGPKVTDAAVSPPVASKPTTSKRARKVLVADSSEDEKPKKVDYIASTFDFMY